MIILAQSLTIEVNAGTQMALITARVLGRLGILDEIMDTTNTKVPKMLRRWQDNKVVNTAPLMLFACSLARRVQENLSICR